jgi:hypothetical protein
LAIHVVDEATTGFLSVYNPTVRVIRERVPWLPLPTFSFSEWLAGLAILVAVLFALVPVAYRGVRWITIIAIPFSVLMIGNGLLHIGSSIYTHRWMPGVFSSPILIVASVTSLVCALRQLRRKHKKA